MPLQIAIPFVDDALGNSVVYEEYKGDLAQASQIADEKLNDARQQRDPARLADALLARGVVYLLQGEPPAATDCFRELEQTVPDDFDRRLRAASYANLATFWHYNLFPDGNGASATELELRWNGEEYLRAEIPRRQAIFNQASQTSSRFESQLIQDFLPNLQPSRSFAQTTYRSSAGPLSETMLQTALQNPVTFGEAARGYGAPLALIAYADLAAADLCQRAGNIQLGVEFLRRSQGVYQQNGDAAGMAACQMMWGDWLAAPLSSPRVWNFAIEESNSSGSGLSWTLEAAEFNRDDTNLNQADVAYSEAERLFHIAGAPRGLAHVELRRGYVAILRGDYPAAIRNAKKAQDAFENCGDRLGYWLAQAHRILCRIGAGQYPEDQKTAEAIGKWGAAEGSFSYALGLGLFLGRAGRYWLIKEGDYEQALAAYRLAAALYKALGAISNLAKSLVDQGAVYQALGERTAALTLFEQALDLYDDDIKVRPPMAAAIRPQVVMLATEVYQLYQAGMDADGMERSAAQLQRYVTDLSDGAKDLKSLIQLFNQGGLAQMMSGDAGERAIPRLESLALGNQIRWITERAAVLVPLYRAEKARDAQDQAQADQLFSSALKAAQAASEAQRDFLVALVLSHQKLYDPASEAFQRYLEKGGANAGFTGMLASVMAKMGGEAGQQELRIQQVRTYEQAFTFFVRIKKYELAIGYWRQLINLAGPDWWRDSLEPWLTLSDCAEMYEGLGTLETALEIYDQAIDALESRRNQLSRDELKTALASGRGAQYLFFQAARAALTLAEETDNPALSQNYCARAFGYIERGKARALLDLMAGSMVLTGASNSESRTMRAWRQCNAQLALWRGLLAQEQGKDKVDERRVDELRTRITAQGIELRKIEAELAQSDPYFYQALDVKAQIISSQQAQAGLPHGTALLQYAFLGDDLLIWAITRQGIVKTHRATVEAKALARKMRDFHSACMKRRTTEPLGTELAEILLNPLATIIRAHSDLIVVPYGAAHTLPFQALPWEGKPLAATHTLRYLPSVSTLQFVRSGEPGKFPDRILTVGNPKDMNYQPPLGEAGRSLPELPAAATEAAYVASLFPEGLVLIGDQATEARVRALLADYPLLLFATHGVLSEEAPLLSAILLANGEAINVYELMGLQLNADLVVLSACRTALGEITGGDDVIGLTRGLLGAGARAAVVSLWPVNDVSTSLFMGEFFRQLRQLEGNPARALSAAQDYLRQLSLDEINTELERLRQKLAAGKADAAVLTALDKDRATRDAYIEGQDVPSPNNYSHPFYWAPFVLVG